MFGQFVINGLITGILYSLLAIGFALVYNTTKIFHVAAAGIYVVSAYAFWFGVDVLSLPMWIAAVFSIAVTMACSYLCELLVYMPLKRKGASNNICMVASIGIMTALVSLVAMLFGNTTKAIFWDAMDTYSFAGISLSKPQMVQLISGTPIILGFLALLRFSDVGIRLKAVSVNETLYTSLGYSLKGVRGLAFLLSGLFIAVAAILNVSEVGMDPNMGMGILFNALIAMILGGIGRFDACVIGGLILGLLQSLVLMQFTSSWQNAITFVVLLVVLFVRPQGFLGYKQRVV
jgi:branched-chain amino acid transport system permease protein